MIRLHIYMVYTGSYSVNNFSTMYFPYNWSKVMSSKKINKSILEDLAGKGVVYLFLIYIS